MTNDTGAELERFGCAWVAMDAEGCIREANATAQGWFEGSSVGQSFGDCLTSASAVYWHTVVVPHVHGRTPLQGVALSLKSPEGAVHALCAFSPHQDGVDALLFPNSERRAFEEAQARLEELEAQDRLIRAAARLRRNFVNEAAHQLATPLTPAVMHLSMLRKKLAGQPDVQRGLDALEKSMGIIREFVAQAQSLDEVLDVGEPLRYFDLAALVRKVATAKGLEPSLADLPDVQAWGAPKKSEQAIAAVLANAVKFGQDKPITIRVTANPPTLHVVDQGIGIDPSNAFRLGEPFSQLFDPKEITALGMGMGLHLAIQAMESQDGSLRVTSEGLQQGAEATLAWPKGPDADGKD